MVRSTTILAILLLLVATPALAQTTQEASDGFSVDWAKPTLHGVSAAGLPPVRDAIRPRLVLNLPAPKPVQLSHLDFGAYEPFGQALTTPIDKRPEMRSLSGGGGLDDPKLWVNGNEYRTTIGTSVVHTVGPTAVRARAGAVVPGMPNVGDRAHKVFLRASDVKVDVRYKF